MTAGIVLDAETAALWDSRWWCHVQGFLPHRPRHRPTLGTVLLAIGGRPVDELVAAHDQGKAHAEWLRGNVRWLPYGMRWTRTLAAADFLDAQADALIAPALVAAWHGQRAADGAGS